LNRRQRLFEKVFFFSIFLNFYLEREGFKFLGRAVRGSAATEGKLFFNLPNEDGSFYFGETIEERRVEDCVTDGELLNERGRTTAVTRHKRSRARKDWISKSQ